jgi:phosphoglycerate dehydrogenase-like enzyme
MTRPVVVLAMGSTELAGRLISPAALARLRSVAQIDAGLVLTEFDSAAARRALALADVLLTGWDCPLVDAPVLEAAPRLQAIVHAGGTVRGIVDDACWDRGIAVATSADANAVPVAEYTLAAILLAGKRVFEAERRLRSERKEIDLLRDFADVGNHHRTIGIVGASRIGRLVLGLLRPFDYDVLVFDPFLADDEARALGARRAGLRELAAASSILTLHAPVLPATLGMISKEVLAAMPDGSTLINTARGALVDHPALEAELASGRLRAVLDVTTPEPLPSDSPLYELPNVVLTPHIAGAAGVELQLLGAWAVDEVVRFAAGEPFRAPVTRADLERMA